MIHTIINKVYSEEDLPDAFESIQERVYLTMNDVDYRYYRVIVSEISEEEYNESTYD